MENHLVNWFEIPVLDIEKAKKFYSELFSVSIEDLQMPGTKMAAFPMLEGATGATGALVQDDSYKPSADGVVIYFSCSNVEEKLKQAKELGASILQDKSPIGEHGFIGSFIDPDGNKIALHSME